MEAEVYPNERVAQVINSDFIPAKIHVKEQPETFKRFNVQWTPTQLVMSPEGVEVHRIEGFLPAEDLLAQLAIGRAMVAFKAEDYAEAEKRFRAALERYPNTEEAPQAAYWAGVSAYKATNDAGKLKETHQALQSKYPQSEWARKASVWSK